MPRTRSSLVAVALGALALACSSKNAGPDGGSTGASGGTSGGVSGTGSSGGASSGGVSGGTTGGCVYDVDCLATGKRCSPDGGCTLPATICNANEGSSNCTNSSYCWPDGINIENDCYCHPLPDGGGLCYVQLPPCAPCTNPIDCGPPSQDDDTAQTCGQLATGTGSYCLPLYLTGTCPSGFIPGVTDGGSIAVCVPSCGTCPCSGCTTNADCANPAAGVCNAHGVCEAPCQAASDCPTGQVCNVLGKYLNPDLGTLYAAGQCGPACTGNSGCSQYREGASVPLICDADAGSICRPAGCLHDTDCTGQSTPGANVAAWCDIWSTNQCVSDACRLGLSPLTGAVFDDCVGGFECELADGGAPGPFVDGGAPILGACFQIPCNEVPGGAHTVCTAGQLCCGEGDAGTSCGGAQVGACYPEPMPPWCQTCNPGNGTYSNPACASVNDGFLGPVACLTAPSVGHTEPWCSPSCNPDQLWTCPAGWDCNRQSFLATDCSSCPLSCLDAGQIQGTQAYQCGCSDGGSACPSVTEGSLSIQMQCDNDVCILGYDCESTVFGCPDGG